MEPAGTQEEYLLRFAEEESASACSVLQARGCPLHEAEDILGGLLLDFLLKIRAGGLPLNENRYEDLKRYAWASIRNQGLNFHRKRARRAEQTTLEMDWEDVRSDEIWLFWTRFPDAVEEAVMELSPKLRSVAALAFVDREDKQPSRREMAMLLGVTEDSIHKNLCRARTQLRKRLQPQYDQWKEITLS